MEDKAEKKAEGFSKTHIAFLVVAMIAGGFLGKIYRDRHHAVASDALPAPPAGLAKPAWELPQAIDEAAGYLSRVCDEKGRFVYRMMPNGSPIAPKKYNIVRHAGAIYALGDYQVQGHDVAGRAKAAATTERAATYLIDRYVRPSKKNPELVAVWSDPVEEGGGGKEWAKLGAAGLSVIGLMGRYRAVDGGTASAPKELEAAQGLARFIQFMQQDDGSYISKYTDEGGKADDFNSLYYPGEATLGLTMLYEADHDPKWLDTAMKGVGRLVISRRGSTNLPPDHWLMIAIDRLAPFYDKVTAPSVSKDEMIDHGVAIGRMIMEGQRAVFGERPAIDGCFTRDGRTTPTATRLEGLLAMEHLLTGDEQRTAAREELRASIVRGIAFLRRSQITDGPARGGIPGAMFVAGEDAGVGDDDERPEEIRIDYVQHAMSAMMRYTVMCANDASGCP